MGNENDVRSIRKEHGTNRRRKGDGEKEGNIFGVGGGEGCWGKRWER